MKCSKDYVDQIVRSEYKFTEEDGCYDDDCFVLCLWMVVDVIDNGCFVIHFIGVGVILE